MFLRLGSFIRITQQTEKHGMYLYSCLLGQFLFFSSLSEWIHCHFTQLCPFSIGVNSERKEFAPLGANSSFLK